MNTSVRAATEDWSILVGIVCPHFDEIRRKKYVAIREAGHVYFAVEDEGFEGKLGTVHVLFDNRGSRAGIADRVGYGFVERCANVDLATAAGTHVVGWFDNDGKQDAGPPVSESARLRAVQPLCR